MFRYRAIRQVVKPRPDRALPPGTTWIGHCGRQAQRRYLRQRWALVERLPDEASRVARARVSEATAGEPDPEFGRMHLAHVALLAAADCRVPWAVAMVDLLDRFEQRAGEGEEPVAAAS
jgi:hypothetical protein